jgi:hypothetical protein
MQVGHKARAKTKATAKRDGAERPPVTAHLLGKSLEFNSLPVPL